MTAEEWGKFNDLIRRIAQLYKIQQVEVATKYFIPVIDVEMILSSYDQAMKKIYMEFTKIFIPSLDCIVSEDWDYTYIIWCKNSDSIEALKPLISEVGLFSFQDFT